MNTDKHGYPASRPAIIFQLAFVLVLAGGGLKLVAEQNPYTPIVTRNVFALVPIPIHNPADDVPVNPPPKITPNGIMNIFGRLQVLFKVTETSPGQPPKDVSYTMAEGERQDDIEVQKIDEKAATITFKNHGAVQTLELVKSSGGGGAPPAGPAGIVPPRPFFPTPGRPAGGGPGAIGFGGRFGRNRNVPGAGSPGMSSPAPAFSGGGTTASSGNATSSVEPMSPEAQVIMMEAQRAKWLNEGNPAAAIIPPTPITKQVTGEDDSGGSGGPSAP